MNINLKQRQHTEEKKRTLQTTDVDKGFARAGIIIHQPQANF